MKDAIIALEAQVPTHLELRKLHDIPQLDGCPPERLERYHAALFHCWMMPEDAPPEPPPRCEAEHSGNRCLELAGHDDHHRYGGFKW